jgi:hypothetical protein
MHLREERAQSTQPSSQFSLTARGTSSKGMICERVNLERLGDRSEKAAIIPCPKSPELLTTQLHHEIRRQKGQTAVTIADEIGLYRAQFLSRNFTTSMTLQIQNRPNLIRLEIVVNPVRRPRRVIQKIRLDNAPVALVALAPSTLAFDLC